MLRDKVVLVTGAGRGIGRAHALAIARLGAAVVVNDIGADVRGDLPGDARDAGIAERVAGEVRALGGRAVASTDDIATWDGAGRAVRRGIEAFGRLDGLVNNAGSLRSAELADLTETDFDALVRVHLKGSFGCTAHALAHWRDEARAGRRPRASVVNTFSEAVLVSFPRHGAYSAVKAGTVQLTTTASREAAAYGVRLNAYGPRALTRQSAATYVGVEALDDAPHPKSPGNSSPLVAWLLSDRSDHVTGQVFQTVGGGIARVTPWSAGAICRPPQGRHRFELDEIGPALDAALFGARVPPRSLDPARESPAAGGNPTA